MYMDAQEGAPWHERVFSDSPSLCFDSSIEVCFDFGGGCNWSVDELCLRARPNLAIKEIWYGELLFAVTRTLTRDNNVIAPQGRAAAEKEFRLIRH